MEIPNLTLFGYSYVTVTAGTTTIDLPPMWHGIDFEVLVQVVEPPSSSATQFIVTYGIGEFTALVLDGAGDPIDGTQTPVRISWFALLHHPCYPMQPN